MLFELICYIHKHEINFLTNLKLESHLNSLICQLIELCSQLPENDSLNSYDSILDFTAYRRALNDLEFQSNSRCESNNTG